MKRSSIYLFLIIAAGLLTSCQLFGSRDSNTDKPSSSYFPLTTGSNWTYTVYDSAYSARHGTNRLDSTSQERVRESILKNIQADSNHVTSLWQFQFSGQIDTVSISSASDSVKLEIPSISYGPTTFIFPLHIGQKWSGKGINGTYEVISADTLSFNGMSFSNAWHIVQYPEEAIGNEYVNIEYWIQPGVGIIKIYIRDNCTVCGSAGTSKVVVWKLLSYNVSP